MDFSLSYRRGSKMLTLAFAGVRAEVTVITAGAFGSTGVQTGVIKISLLRSIAKNHMTKPMGTASQTDRQNM